MSKFILGAVPQRSLKRKVKGKVSEGKAFFGPVLTSRVREFWSSSRQRKSVDFASDSESSIFYWCCADYFWIFLDILDIFGFLELKNHVKNYFPKTFAMPELHIESY